MAVVMIPDEPRERSPGTVYQEISETWVRLADLYAELGRSISEARRRRVLSQTQLAEILELTRSALCSYERGVRWRRDVPAIERVVRFLSR